MSSPAPLPMKMTPAEYLEWESQQTEKHEYYNGEVSSHAGGPRNHSLIGGNVLGELRHALKDQDCQALGSDMRVHIKATDDFVYPDVSVVCPPVESARDDVISNPVLVVEVLSPSTIDYDRGTKFGNYRQIPSLRDYVVIWQDEPRVEHHQKTDEGIWQLRDIVGIDATLRFASIDCELPVREVYAKVEFENVTDRSKTNTSTRRSQS